MEILFIRDGKTVISSVTLEAAMFVWQSGKFDVKVGDKVFSPTDDRGRRAIINSFIKWRDVPQIKWKNVPQIKWRNL
jgi:hypothetical protein